MHFSIQSCSFLITVHHSVHDLSPTFVSLLKVRNIVFIVSLVWLKIKVGAHEKAILVIIHVKFQRKKIITYVHNYMYTVFARHLYKF